MTNWLGGARGMALVIALWIVGWGLGFGGIVEAVLDPNGKTLDMWPIEMAVPGFIGGVIFALVLRFLESGRSFDEIPLSRAAAWGAVTGLIVGFVAIATGAGSVVFEGLVQVARGNQGAAFDNEPLSLAAAGLMGIAIGLGIVAAIGTAVFARLLVRRQRPATASRAS